MVVSTRVLLTGDSVPLLENPAQNPDDNHLRQTATDNRVLLLHRRPFDRQILHDVLTNEMTTKLVLVG